VDRSRLISKAQDHTYTKCQELESSHRRSCISSLRSAPEGRGGAFSFFTFTGVGGGAAKRARGAEPEAATCT
jgi:hypothetical protein